MRNRSSARKTTGEANLPELFDRLELALAQMPARTSLCKALSDLNRRLGSSGVKAVARTRRAAPRRPRPTPVESLPLFS